MKPIYKLWLVLDLVEISVLAAILVTLRRSRR
jgi:hypothetical protein